MIELQQLTLQRQGKQILGPLDLRLAPGELLAVIGANGAGKSSLLSLLCGLTAPSSGSVRYQSNVGSTPNVLARQRAMMPQFHALSFDFSVREVVALGRNPHHGHCSLDTHEAVIERAMMMADVHTLASRCYTRLSGGQQARVQFARVLAQLNCGEGEARLMLLDEPTASLDLRSQRSLMECVRQLCDRGLSAVAVLHDINLAAHYADRIAILKEGRLLSIGPADEVITEPLISDAFQLPVKVLERALPDRRLVVV